jgi:hypothetical protein
MRVLNPVVLALASDMFAGQTEFTDRSRVGASDEVVMLENAMLREGPPLSPRPTRVRNDELDERAADGG